MKSEKSQLAFGVSTNRISCPTTSWLRATYNCTSTRPGTPAARLVGPGLHQGAPAAAPGALRRLPHTQGGASIARAERGHAAVPLHQVCVVCWGVVWVVRQIGIFSPCAPSPLPPAPHYHQLGGERRPGRRERRPGLAPSAWWAALSPPSLPNHHHLLPTMPCHPHLHWQQRMGVGRPNPSIHPHPRPSQLSPDARWRSQPVLGTILHGLAGPDRPLPAQTHTPNMPPHVHFHPPPQAHGGGGGGNRPHGPGISTQVRMNRSRPRVVRAVGRRRRLLFVIVLCCGHTTPTLAFFTPTPGP